MGIFKRILRLLEPLGKVQSDNKKLDKNIRALEICIILEIRQSSKRGNIPTEYIYNYAERCEVCYSNRHHSHYFTIGDLQVCVTCRNRWVELNDPENYIPRYAPRYVYM